MTNRTDIVHETLPCGIEYAVDPMPGRHVVCLQARMLTGACEDPPGQLGLAHLVGDTIDKGTAHHTGQSLLDAFDEIGAGHRISTGRETTTIQISVLPDHVRRAVELLAEILRTPTFPEEMVQVNRDLALQEIAALEDDAQGFADKLISAPAYGPLLGRHPLGEAETVSSIQRPDLVSFWQDRFNAGRMLVSVAGAVEAGTVADLLEKHFDGFGPATPAGREGYPVKFSPVTRHFDKPLEQEQVGICWPGADAASDDYFAQQVMIGLLSGGMSGRLFTEVREKQGLVYWVGAWQETPRGFGMIFLGASTTPERCDRTYRAMMHEVDRLADDIQDEELARAITGLVVQHDTRGDSTGAHCSELASDLYFHGRPIPVAEKVSRIEAVTADTVRAYLDAYPRDRRCVVTLGPRSLSDLKSDAATAAV